MSIPFSDETNKNGVIQVIEQTLKYDDGAITGSTFLFKKFTAAVNLAWDKVLSIIFKAAGKWQFDDTNHPKYPTITTKLWANQRDYTFTEDGQGNLILDIYKVMIKNPQGIYFEIFPVDQQSDEYTQGFWSGLNQTGIPSRYDKTANGLFLDCIPNYDMDKGIKMFINREGTYFTTADTDKKPGFAGLFHKYLAIEPSYQQACIDQLAYKNDLKLQMAEMELDIKQYYRDRSKDEVLVVTSETVDSM